MCLNIRSNKLLSSKRKYRGGNLINTKIHSSKVFPTHKVSLVNCMDVDKDKAGVIPPILVLCFRFDYIQLVSGSCLCRIVQSAAGRSQIFIIISIDIWC